MSIDHILLPFQLPSGSATGYMLDEFATSGGQTRDLDVEMLMDTCEYAPNQPWASLTTVNFDVQRHIMSFLWPPDLSSLMRTCRTFFHVGLLPMCACSKVPLKTPAQIMSFLQFLRLDNPSSTRAPLIRNLNFNLEEYRAPLSKTTYFNLEECNPSSYFALPQIHPREEEHLLLASRNGALEAFLNILQCCRNLRCLRVDRWYEDVPVTMLRCAIASLPVLEDICVPMFPRAQWEYECGLVNLPLRRLVASSGRWCEIPSILSILQPLATTLVELDIPVCQWNAPGITFPRVQRLGIEFPASEDVASELVRTFPTMTHLTLRGARHFHLCHTPRSRMEEDRLREQSQYQWHALAGAWPSFVMVSTESTCALYTLALPRHVPCLSIGYSTGDPSDSMLPAILTDARPTCLEMRIKQVHYKYVPLLRRFGGLKPGDATTSLRRFILTMGGDGIMDYLKVAPLLVDELQQALSGLAVTHLLLKHSIGHFRASRSYTRRVVRALCAQASVRAAALANAVPSLRWIGTYVQVKDGPCWLYCWDVSRVASRVEEFAYNVSTAAATPQGVSLVEMKEDEGWDVLMAEEMDELARA